MLLIAMLKKARTTFKSLTLLLLCSSFCMEAKIPAPTGTLIVTYQTGAKGERLDRIRFWLKGEAQEAEMYPQDSKIEGDRESRTVVIENLPFGNYTLQFLIPNKDGFFKEVPTRQITIQSTDPIKIDQKIKPKSN